MSGAAPPGGAPDPSMEEILASIRRILSEDEAQTPPSPAEPAHPSGQHALPPPAPPADDVLALDASMMESEPPPPRAAPAPVPDSPTPMPEPMRPEPIRPEVNAEEPPRFQARPPLLVEPFEPPPSRERAGVAPARPSALAAAVEEQFGGTGEAFESLVAPEAAAAAASSMGSLMRRLAAERSAPVYRSGPTIEDLVRDEMRPMLKEWLDTHLPLLVERLVRVEIERVVSGSIR